VLPFYLGDDTTDEDAFAVLQGRGIGILVGCPTRETAARYVLGRPADVGRFLGNLASTLGGRRRA
jgi:trehalose-phosphatase